MVFVLALMDIIKMILKGIVSNVLSPAKNVKALPVVAYSVSQDLYGMARSVYVKRVILIIHKINALIVILIAINVNKKIKIVSNVMKTISCCLFSQH